MATTKSPEQMLYEEEQRKTRRGMRALDPSRAEGPATSDVNFRPRTGADPAPAPPPNGGALGEQPGAGYIAGQTIRNLNPLTSGSVTKDYWTGQGPNLSGTLAPKPKTTDQLLMDEANGYKPASSPSVPAPTAQGATRPQGGFAGMGDRSMQDMHPEMLMLADTEQGRRDLAMLRKQRNLADAALMGSSNQYSKFYNPGQTPDQRAELILSKEGMNQQLATAQRAANPPRYADTPGKSSEQMLYEESARNRQQQAVSQANTDQGVRDKERQYKLELSDATRAAELDRAKAAGSVAKAEGTVAESAANRAAAEAEIAQVALPNEVARARAIEQRGNSPVYMPAVSGAVNSIKQLSGKAVIGASDKVAMQRLEESFSQIQGMPPELQDLAAAEVLHTLSDSNLDLPKEAFQDSFFTWLFSRPSQWLGTGTAPRTNTAQDRINKVLADFKEKAARAGVNPQMFAPTAR